MSSDSFHSDSKWPLAIALVAVLAVRVPMITDTVEVLDSDAAVNGLTLKHLLEGRWRWHYPGLTYMGTTELLLALPGALIFGANPWTLTVAPVLAYALLTIAVYVLTRRLYGPRSANWSLVALVFTSTDVLFWSSFPIGGHALVTFWHVSALVLLGSYLQRGRISKLVILGLWLGLGYYTYQMFLFSLVLIVPVALFGRAGPTRRRAGSAAWGLFVVAFLLGWSPHLIGKQTVENDVYGSQTRPARSVQWLKKSVPVLIEDGLPKFVAGPGQTGEGLPPLDPIDQAARLTLFGVWLVVTVAFYRLLIGSRTNRLPGRFRNRTQDEQTVDPSRTIELLVALTPPLVLAGFLFHPAVDNHTHSRYLIYLMAWWPIAFGAVVGNRLTVDKRSSGVAARLAMLLLTSLFVVASGIETYRYLRVREAITRFGVPVVPAEQPIVSYLKSQKSFAALYGGYWDVYRFTFLTDEQVKGVPVQGFPTSPLFLNLFDHLRMPEYADEARRADRIGVIVRRTQRARWRPPAGLRPSYQDDKYLVYVVPPPR